MIATRRRAISMNVKRSLPLFHTISFDSHHFGCGAITEHNSKYKIILSFFIKPEHFSCAFKGSAKLYTAFCFQWKIIPEIHLALAFWLSRHQALADTHKHTTTT